MSEPLLFDAPAERAIDLDAASTRPTPAASRFEVRPQKHSTAYPYDGGYMIFDLVQRRAVGWAERKKDAEQTATDLQREVDTGLWDRVR